MRLFERLDQQAMIGSLALFCLCNLNRLSRSASPSVTVALRFTVMALNETQRSGNNLLTVQEDMNLEKVKMTSNL